VRQLYFAILFREDPEILTSLYDLQMEDEDMRFISNASKGLAEITRSGLHTVQFIHESVKDYFLKEAWLGRILPDYKTKLEAHSHNQLKQCCIEYMTMFD
jgi:hypothetical protein